MNTVTVNLFYIYIFYTHALHFMTEKLGKTCQDK